MRKLIVLLLAQVTGSFIFSQNVGIGISTPTKGRFEVQGVAGTGATVAAFGTESTGLSLQRNWPTIGFNQYRDIVTPGSQGKYMSNGFAAIQYFDPLNGAMAIDMIPSGTANTFTPAANRGITILNSGNVGIRTTGSNTASLYVARGTNAEGTAIFGGTQHGSYFNYSTSEDTYIRPGKDGGTVYVNDVANAKVRLGGDATATTTVNGVITINNLIALKESVIAVNSNNLVVDASNTSSLIFTSSDDPGNRRILLTGPTAKEGQLLMIRVNGTTGFDGVKIVSTFNNGTSDYYNFNDRDIGNGDILMVVWHSDRGWMRVSFTSFFD